jgi:hypothetical protein
MKDDPSDPFLGRIDDPDYMKLWEYYNEQKLPKDSDTAFFARDHLDLKQNGLKGIMNLMGEEIKCNNEDDNKLKGAWGAANMVLDVEKDSPTTLYFKMTYEYPETDEKIEKHFALDAIAKDGTVSLHRFGLIGEYNHDDSKNRFIGQDLKISIEVQAIDGRVKNNFDKIDSFSGDPASRTSEADELRQKYREAFYTLCHTSQPQWVLGEKSKEYMGGGVDEFQPKEGRSEARKIFETSIFFDSKSKKTKPAGGDKVLFDAPDRY